MKAGEALKARASKRVCEARTTESGSRSAALREALTSSRLAPFSPAAAWRAIGRSPPAIRVALRVEPEAVTEQQPGDEG
jgi:hypothetical protein